MTQERIPRRLKRFYRKKNKPENKKEFVGGILDSLKRKREREIKKDSRRIALKEVHGFHSKHKRFPAGKELDKISESIFNQIKRAQQKQLFEEKAKKQTQRKERRHKRRRKKPIEIQEKTKQQEISELKELADIDLKELISTDSELNLEEIEKNKPLTELEKELKNIEPTETHFKTEIQTQKNNCPSCKNKTDEIIYCPECGKGFCAHCALKAEKEKSKILYACPKCKTQFKVKKF